ncbi:phosphate ABC transporter permease subunit PstC [Gloeothece verrucosa]|uniref:Phosphate transport system permease protein n=1 Tax=Gloeothece verrucosa (strain PCC 7822) TaxID=497965 RepID=E0UKZ3_GLOV7|nr:phosphate ABC transporter permease subunit PstC [Gloeothece verrucosa]ADN17623.1 phosphate ABC transporter, inner membrane subunit PstC [Gloeothece verrucosa PCC 7822]
MYLLRIIAAFVGVIVVFILVFLMMESMPVLNQVGLLAFLTNDSWNPGDKLYNLTPMLVSTVFVVAGAVVVATPLGILSALFCHYYAPEKIAHFYRRLMELLAGVPGVVYGFWGLMVLIPLINRWHPPGSSLLAGILMLTLLIMPTIALIADASFAGIADEYLHGAISLGLTRSGTIFSLILPIARSELLMGIILATGRALGETMIVLMVCGNIVQIPDSLFAPIRTLPANIALEMDFALGNHRSALFVSGLLLMAISLVLVLLAEAIKDN